MAKHERIYSSHQMKQALHSSVDGVRDQLHVLEMLGGVGSTGSLPPAVHSSLSEMDVVIDSCLQVVRCQEDLISSLEGRVREAEHEAFAAKEAVRQLDADSEGLKKAAAEMTAEARTCKSKLETSLQEVRKQKQDIWSLEKRCSDLSAMADKMRQDNERCEGELKSMRAKYEETHATCTKIKQELAARKSDAMHLQQRAGAQQKELLQLRKQVDSLTSDLQRAESELGSSRASCKQSECEVSSMNREVAKLASELERVSKDAERLRMWEGVQHKIDREKLQEEQEEHQKVELVVLDQLDALERRASKAESECARYREEARESSQEIAALKKQLNSLNLQLLGLQKQNAGGEGEKSQVLKQLEEAKAEIERLEAEVALGQMRVVTNDKERTEAEIELREALEVERLKLRRLNEESEREAGVQKARADTWFRDMEALNRVLARERKQLEEVKAELSELQNSQEEKIFEHFKRDTVVETLQMALEEARSQHEADIARLQAESWSLQKRLEKQVESLKRECSESAAEISRLRRGETLPLLESSRLLHEELAQLRKVALSIPNGDFFRSAGAGVGGGKDLGGRNLLRGSVGGGFIRPGGSGGSGGGDLGGISLLRGSVGADFMRPVGSGGSGGGDLGGSNLLRGSVGADSVRSGGTGGSGGSVLFSQSIGSKSWGGGEVRSGTGGSLGSPVAVPGGLRPLKLPSPPQHPSQKQHSPIYSPSQLVTPMGGQWMGGSGGRMAGSMNSQVDGNYGLGF